eukprot:5940940-Heterocapsa_arctica.AAC.1
MCRAALTCCAAEAARGGRAESLAASRGGAGRQGGRPSDTSVLVGRLGAGPPGQSAHARCPPPWGGCPAA